MIHYSTYQIVSDSDLKFLEENFKNFELIKRKDRAYYSINIEDASVFPIIQKILIWIEQTLNIKFISYNSFKKLMFHKFIKNHFFSNHSDNTHISPTQNRKFAVGFHINDDYIGGEYVLTDINHTINNTPGFVYIFDSYMKHEVKPVLEGERKSIIFFINYEDIIVNDKKEML